MTNRERTRNSGNVQTPINVYRFDPEGLPDPAPVSTVLPPADNTRQYGAYGVARLSLADPLKMIVGSRISWYRYRTSEGVRTHHEAGVVSPYAGVIYDIDRTFSAYASYSDRFMPQSNLDSRGNPIDPVVGANHELGVKGEFLDGALNASVAAFRLAQTNLPKIDENFGNDPTNVCGGWCYIAQDKVVSRGVDVSVSGEVRPGWNLNFGYTYVKSKYASGDLKGNPFRTEVPNHIVRIATSYRLPDSRWTVGGSVSAQSRFYSAGVRTGIAWRVEQDSLTLVDLMAKYDIGEKSYVTVNVDNVFGTRYFASTNSLYYVPYGEPRRFTLSITHGF